MSRAESGRRHRVVSIVGTRPEAIKMLPVVEALAVRPRLDQKVVLTGQHKGLAGMFQRLDPARLRQLPYEPGGRTAAQLRESLHHLLCGHFAGEPADLVLVQGDTASAFAGALAAHDCRIPLGHVEAGLRSFDLRQPWPEEGNRTAIDALSHLLFAPTDQAARNLERDWRVKGQIFLTGNTGIDALLKARSGMPPDSGPDGAAKTLLVTCHRKENHGEPVRSICAALKRLVRGFPLEVVLPLHPNPHVRSEMERLLGDEPRVALVEPLDHGDMVRLMEACWLILTDSGGIQEEGPALGKPVLVLRNVTERTEAVASENIELVGTGADAIVAAVERLLTDPGRYARMARPSFPFGDGKAAPRIAEAVEDWLAARARRAA